MGGACKILGKMAPRSHLDLDVQTSSLPEFFREKVSESLQTHKVAASPEAEFYLVNLLATFSKSHHLFEVTEDGALEDRALALRLYDAIEAAPQVRIPILKKLGDVALYLSGFFGDGLLGSSPVGLDYYMQMGHTAYSSLSTLVSGRPSTNTGSLYGELAHKFGPFVEVLSGVANATIFRNDHDLLKLYERWLTTGSERAKNILSREGILPNPQVKTRYEH